MTQLRAALITVTMLLSIQAYSYDCYFSCDAEGMSCFQGNYLLQHDRYLDTHKQHVSDFKDELKYDLTASTKILEKKLRIFTRKIKNYPKRSSLASKRRDNYDLNRFDNFVEFSQERNSGCDGNKRYIRKVGKAIDKYKSFYDKAISDYDRTDWLKNTVKLINNELTKRQTQNQKPKKQEAKRPFRHFECEMACPTDAGLACVNKIYPEIRENNKNIKNNRRYYSQFSADYKGIGSAQYFNSKVDEFQDLITELKQQKEAIRRHGAGSIYMFLDFNDYAKTRESGCNAGQIGAIEEMASDVKDTFHKHRKRGYMFYNNLIAELEAAIKQMRAKTKEMKMNSHSPGESNADKIMNQILSMEAKRPKYAKDQSYRSGVTDE